MLPSSPPSTDTNVRLRRVLTSDVNSPETSYRYQGAFIYEDYADLNTQFSDNREYYTQRQHDYETHLGFKLIADHFGGKMEDGGDDSYCEKPCFTAALSVGCLERLLRLGRAYKGSDMETIKNTLPEWKEVAQELSELLKDLLVVSTTPPTSTRTVSHATSPSPQSSGNSSIFSLSRGYFMKMQETSAKEFTCYYGYDATNGEVDQTTTRKETTATTHVGGTGSAAVRIYARDGDVPLPQRRAHKQAIMAKAPTIPGCVSSLPSATPTPTPTTNTSIPPSPPHCPLGGGGGPPPPPPPPPQPKRSYNSPLPPPISAGERVGAGVHQQHHSYPELTLLRGLGPFTDIHLIIGALVGHEKSQIFIEKHVQRGESMDMFLLPWDDGMDMDREFRVFVDERSRVTAISPWNPFGAYPSTNSTAPGTGTTATVPAPPLGGGATRDADTSRIAFPWIDALSDADLKHLASDIATYVEERIVPIVLAHTPFKSCTVDVLVREAAVVAPEQQGNKDDGAVCNGGVVHPTTTPTLPQPTATITTPTITHRRWDISLVETGPFGPFMHAGSTLFHWLEEDVFDRQDINDRTIDMRVLTDDESRGERLSVTKPVRKPDLFE